MDIELYSAAARRVGNAPLLINMVSKRVRQLNQGERGLLKRRDRNEDNLDLALREIADGLLIAEMEYAAPKDGEDDE